MKSAVVLLLLALVIGIARHGRLIVVNREVSQLEARLNGASNMRSVSPVERSRTLRRDAGLSAELPAELEAKVRLSFDLPGTTEEREAAWKVLVKEFSRLDHRTVAALIGNLRQGQPLPLSADGGICGFAIDLLARANPAEAMLLLESLADFGDRGKVAADAFRRWGIDRPMEAIGWYDDLAAKGDLLAAEPALIEKVVQVEARIDPAGALARVLSLELPFKPEDILDLGAVIARELRTGQEHLAFLEALRRTEKRTPDSTALADLRSGYIKSLVALLHSWPFEEAVGLIDAGFRPEDREQIVSRIARDLELAESERWATWIAAVDAPANTRHPVTSLIYNWARSDPESAGRWLDGMPTGELKEKAVESYVSSVSAEDPELALPRALGLREGRRRTGLLKLIYSSWQKKNPAAAAEFAREHGL